MSARPKQFRIYGESGVDLGVVGEDHPMLAGGGDAPKPKKGKVVPIRPAAKPASEIGVGERTSVRCKLDEPGVKDGRVGEFGVERVR